MGLVGYFRMYIPNLAELTGPFRELLIMKVKWQWIESHEKPLDTLKQIIYSQRMLKVLF